MKTKRSQKEILPTCTLQDSRTLIRMIDRVMEKYTFCYHEQIAQEGVKEEEFDSAVENAEKDFQSIGRQLQIIPFLMDTSLQSFLEEQERKRLLEEIYKLTPNMILDHTLERMKKLKKGENGK